MDKEKDFLKKQQKQIDKQFKNARKVYDAQLKELQALQPQYERSIVEGIEAQKPILQQQATTAMEGLGLQREQTKGARESALTQARRQYEQGLQKTQQLFGGVAPTSAAVASADILGAEQLRQMGQAQTQSAQNLMQIGTAERDVQAQLSNSLRQLEVQKQQDIMKLRDAFRQEINQINQAKGTLAQNKATLQLQALQDFNNRRRALEDVVTEQRMNLETYAQQLRMANQYQTPTADALARNIQIPDLRNQTEAQRRATLQNLMSTDAGKLALANAGFESMVVGGQNVLYNPFNGLTVGLSGRRFADYAPNFIGTNQPIGQLSGPQAGSGPTTGQQIGQAALNQIRR